MDHDVLPTADSDSELPEAVEILRLT